MERAHEVVHVTGFMFWLHIYCIARQSLESLQKLPYGQNPQHNNKHVKTWHLPVSVFLQHGPKTVSNGFLCGAQMRIDIHLEFFV